MDGEIIKLIRERYPDGDTKLLAAELGMSVSALKTIASRYGIRKSADYWKKQHLELMRAKEQRYLESIPEIKLSEEEQAILVGSLLGDGTLSFAPRSRYPYYREHFGEGLRDYREWKRKKLQRLGFKITRDNHLRGPSHPVFGELYSCFFRDGRKVITQENLKLLSSPLALACFFFDDGTLVVNKCRRANYVFLTPTLTLYTMSFSYKENQLLAGHLKNSFGVRFSLKKVPFGTGWSLSCGTARDVFRFMKLVAPFGQEVPSMRRKIALLPLLAEIKAELKSELGEQTLITWPDFEREPNDYTDEEVKRLIRMKRAGRSDREIAAALGRTYWSVVYKASTLRKAGRLN